MFFQKQKRKPMRRYVYLMERNPSLWKELFGMKREIKIGVAKSAKDRLQDVNAGIPGDVVLLEKYLVEEATKVEAHLHQIFKNQRYTVRGAKSGSGKTEFFKLNNQQVRQAKEILEQKQEVSTLSFFIIALLMLLLLWVMSL